MVSSDKKLSAIGFLRFETSNAFKINHVDHKMVG